MALPDPLLIHHAPPTRAGERQDWLGLSGDARALAIAETAARHDGPLMLITPGMVEAEALRRGLRFFGVDDIELMPDWEILPYDLFSPHQDITSERLRALHRLPRKTHGVVIVPAATLMQRIAPPAFLEGTVIRLATGQSLNLEAMRTSLQASGYRCVSEVLEHGEFAVRGAILDLYPMGAEAPYRIDLFDDEIDTIRRFDPACPQMLVFTPCSRHV